MGLFSKKAKETEYKPAICDISVRIGCYDSGITDEFRVWEIIGDNKMILLIVDTQNLIMNRDLYD